MGNDPKDKQEPDELSPDDLESVTGGASTDYLLEIDGVKGESRVKVMFPRTSATAKLQG